jgi:hypothetical protein
VRFRAWVGERPVDARNMWSGSLLPYAVLTLTGRKRSAKQEEVSI